MTTAPKTRSCATLASGAVSGTKITVFMSRLAVRQASENLDLANGRYATGVGNPIEVTDSLVAQANARTAHVAALYNFKMAQAGLEKAMGVVK